VRPELFGDLDAKRARRREDQGLES
jgi:hypothetical protein